MGKKKGIVAKSENFSRKGGKEKNNNKERKEIT